MSIESTGALAPEHYIPQSVRDNYAAIARDAAAARGGTAKGAMRELAKDFASRHREDPTAGWDHLAVWAKTFDPEAQAGPSPLELAASRAVESARRDPANALTAVALAQTVAEETLKAAGEAPATPVDPSTGVVPNPGGVPVETTTT